MKNSPTTSDASSSSSSDTVSTQSKTLTFSSYKRKRESTDVDSAPAAKRRTRNVYDPKSDKPFQISRSKLELFRKCPRCFYLDRRLGLNPPKSLPFALNSAVDELLKKEFDYYRELKLPHPLMVAAGINAIPYQHEKLNAWRDTLHGGVEYLMPNTNLKLTGAVDDLWLNTNTNQIYVVDYKATAANKTVSLDAPWQISFKHQIEFYQWLLLKNDFPVNDTAYFVYCNGKKSEAQFNAQLKFDISVLPHTGKHDWIEETILKAYACLQSDNIPEASSNCELCCYLSIHNDLMKTHAPSSKIKCNP